jgi:2-hydroxy-3-keto-5-methylthiopentenyl-1-phosphate phosphatase
MSKRLAIICDLDGTLSNIDHRKHYVERTGKRDWKNFFLQMPSDTVNKWCRYLVEQMALRFDVLICTGRPEQFRSETEEWLKKHEIPYKRLFMRPINNQKPDNEVKSELYEQHIKPLYEVIFVVDDRQSAVDMWRRKGLACLQYSQMEL